MAVVVASFPVKQSRMTVKVYQQGDELTVGVGGGTQRMTPDQLESLIEALSQAEHFVCVSLEAVAAGS